MKNVKRITSLVLVFILIFSLAGCDKPKFLSKISLKNIFNKEEVSETIPDTTYIDYNNVTNVTDAYVEPVTDGTAPSTATTAPVTQSNNTTAPQTEKPTQSPTTTKSPTPVVETGVGSYKATYSIEQVVYYPNSMKSSNQKLPVLAFANGTGCSYTLYENLLKSIAEGGYIVVANAETMAADGTAQINSIEFALSENINKNSILYNKVAADKIGVIGHSQGGRSSVNAAVKDSRIKCVISLAGSNFLEEAEPLKSPTLFMTGTSDMIVSSSQWVKPAYDVAKGPAVYASLSKGIHTTCCTNPEKYTYYCVKWFDAFLKNDGSAKAIFKNGGELSKDGNWVDFASKNF